MALSDPTTAAPRTVGVESVTGPGDRPAHNGQRRRALADRAAVAADQGVADPPHRPRRGGNKQATPNTHNRNGHAVEEAHSAEPGPSDGRTGDNGEVVNQKRRRSAAKAASRQSRSAGTLDDLEPLDGTEAETDGPSTAAAQPQEPLTFAEVQEAHLAASRTFREIRRSLNESYRMIGRLNVERYELQVELAELKGLPMPERPPERSWNAAAAPVAPLAAQRLQRNREQPSEEEEVDEEKVRQIARRRQLTLVGVIAGIALFALIYRLAGWHWFPNLADREAMADIAGIGILMQVFFLIFFVFRIGMLTGKGRSWLFPTAEAESHKRRRKRVRGH